MSTTGTKGRSASNKKELPLSSAKIQVIMTVPETTQINPGQPTIKPRVYAKQLGESKQKFLSLVEIWRRETATTSSTDDLISHPAYQSIIGLGPVVIPFILTELETRPDHWFFALRTLTAENPVDPRDRGKIDKMAAAWIQWGRENGYL